MGRLQVRVVMISVGVAALVLVPVAERANSKSFLGYDGTYCVYRRTAALGCGITAAVFLLAGQAVLGGQRLFRPLRRGPRSSSQRAQAQNRQQTLAAAATCMFLYGAWRNAGGTSRPTRGRYHSMRGCRRGLGNGFFSSAAACSAFAFFVGITAYVNQETADPEQPEGIAMGQQPHFQPQQAYPSMGYPPYPAAPPPYGGYGAKAPAGIA